MTGKEAMKKIKTMESTAAEADKLAGYLMEDPDAAEALREHAGVGRSPAVIINTLISSHEMRMESIKKALEEAELPI